MIFIDFHSSFYSKLFQATFHHNKCMTANLYPWHEMTSGERVVVKSGKSMSIAVPMRISVELRAAIAREGILQAEATVPPRDPQSETGTLATPATAMGSFNSFATWRKIYEKSPHLNCLSIDLNSTTGRTMFCQRRLTFCLENL